MPGDDLRKRLMGERPIHSARLYNETIRAVEANNRKADLFSQGEGKREQQPAKIKIRNSSGLDQDRYHVLKVGVPLILPGDNLNEFQNRHFFDGLTPTEDDIFAITQEALAFGAIGEALLIGITTVQVNVIAESDTHAKPVAGDPGGLITSKTGPARIISKESGTGIKWAKVFLNFDRLNWFAARLTSGSGPTYQYAEEDPPGTLKTGGRTGTATEINGALNLAANTHVFVWIAPSNGQAYFSAVSAAERWFAARILSGTGATYTFAEEDPPGTLKVGGVSDTATEVNETADIAAGTTVFVWKSPADGQYYFDFGAATESAIVTVQIDGQGDGTNPNLNVFSWTEVEQDADGDWFPKAGGRTGDATASPMVNPTHEMNARPVRIGTVVELRKAFLEPGETEEDEDIQHYYFAHEVEGCWARLLSHTQSAIPEYDWEEVQSDAGVSWEIRPNGFASDSQGNPQVNPAYESHNIKIETTKDQPIVWMVPSLRREDGTQEWVFESGLTGDFDISSVECVDNEPVVTVLRFKFVAGRLTQVSDVTPEQ